jgi:hypothetical protein
MIHKIKLGNEQVKIIEYTSENLTEIDELTFGTWEKDENKTLIITQGIADVNQSGDYYKLHIFAEIGDYVCIYKNVSWATIIPRNKAISLLKQHDINF